MTERVLTLRELNRATLARQLLLERKRLSPAAVIERLVGMQAQWPPAPYVGIWTRTSGFRRETLERALASGAVVKATAMRQTLHLVTPHDYALIRAAMSEMNFPWETSQAKRLAPVARALAADGPVTSAEGVAALERETGLSGIAARRAWRAARARAHLVHHHETALWHARPEGRFVALDEPEEHIPIEARAEMLRRYLAAFGPASVQDMSRWSMMHMPYLRASLELLEPLRRFRDEQGRELLDVPRARPPPPRDAGARPLPAQVGQPPDRPRRPHARPSGALPEEGDRKERRRGADVPRRRVRRGHVDRRQGPGRRSRRSASWPAAIARSSTRSGSGWRRSSRTE